MFSVRSVGWLVCGACIAFMGGCGNQPARVLAPGHAARASAPDRLHRAADPDGQIPCNPSYVGPVLTLFGPGLEFHYPTGGYCPCPEAQVPIDVPEHETVTFHWSADASGGCTNVRSYRWALDIEDVTDETPRIDEATDLKHWSAPSVASSATVGPFTIPVPPAPNVHYLSIEATDGIGYRSLGILRITVVEAVNRPPEVQSATAELAVDGPANGEFSPVHIGGVTDPDGDAVTITVTGITQDEPLLGFGQRPTCPDARIDDGAASVRRERSGLGNGRVYTIEFVATDGHGGESHGTVEVCIPRDHSPGGCIRDPLVVNSLESCEPLVAHRANRP